MSKSPKKKSKLKMFLTLFLIFIVAIVVGLFLYAKEKLGMMNYQELNKSELGITENLYENIDTNITKSEFDKILTVVLFGTDFKEEGNASNRSDSIMIASVNPNTQSVKLLSIPRDTYVSIKGYGKTKINHAYAYGKEQLSIRTINENFGLNIDKFVTIDFSGLIEIINSMGGVEVEISKEEMNYINYELDHRNDLGDNPNKTKLSDFGVVTLNGEQALMHSRNRTTGGNDFIRANRQRDVLEGIMKKISTMPKTRILSLVDSIFKNISTNIKPEEYIGILSSVFPDINKYTNNIISKQIPSSTYSQDKYINGVYYYSTDFEQAKKEFYEYIFNK